MLVKSWRTRIFSLVEVMTSFGLLAFCLAAVYSLFSFFSFNRDAVDKRDRCLSFAQNQIENLRSMAYSEMIAIVDKDTRLDDNGLPSAGGLYRRTTRVVPDPSAAAAVDSRWSYVVVTVSVPSRFCRPTSTYSLTTVIMDGKFAVNLHPTVR